MSGKVTKSYTAVRSGDRIRIGHHKEKPTSVARGTGAPDDTYSGLLAGYCMNPNCVKPRVRKTYYGTHNEGMSGTCCADCEKEIQRQKKAAYS